MSRHASARLVAVVALAAALAALRPMIPPKALAASALPLHLATPGRELARADTPEELAGMVGKIPGVRALALDLDGVGSRGVDDLPRLRELEYLELEGGTARLVGDALWAAARLPRLMGLDMRAASAEVTAPDLRPLSDLERLRILRVGQLHRPSRLDDAALGPVSRLLNLRELAWVSTEITVVGVRTLADLHGLEVLDVDQNRRPSDEDWTALGELGSLRRLVLSRTQAGDRTARALGHVRGLQRLAMSRTPLTDEGAQALAQLPNLRSLDLSETQVGDAGARALAGMRNLEELNLRGCRQLTRWGAEELRRADIRGLTLPSGI